MREKNKIKIPRFHELRQKLMMIMRKNSNVDKFEFEGFLKNGELGIMVSGSDILNISNFEQFYSINQINHLFKRLDRIHTRR